MYALGGEHSGPVQLVETDELVRIVLHELKGTFKRIAIEYTPLRTQA